MNAHTLLVSTQTPLYRFDAAATGHPAGAHLPPHRISPGGVCRMVLPTLHNLREAGWLKQSYWYALQPGAPTDIDLEPGVHLRHIDMSEEELRPYGRAKEKLWNDIHGLPSEPFSGDDFRHYVRFNTRTSHALLEHAGEVDVAYIHDFQLLQVGALLGLAMPCIMRWHVPFDARLIPRATRNWMVRLMEDFDTVMVSTRRDLQGLVDAGFTGRVRQIYPHIEPADWPAPTAEQVAKLESTWNLKPDTQVFLLVARMDPMKRQDLAVQAFARVHKTHPNARLVLVGNGSFSGKLGTGKGKSAQWREHVVATAHKLGVQDAVTFAHWIPDDLLAAAYARSTAVLLPSDIEGFGLTPLEAWCYGKVPILSDGCGAAEIILDGINGHVFPSGNPEALAKAMLSVLANPERAERMGAMGRETLPRFTAKAVNPHIRAIMDEAIDKYRTA